MDGEFRWNKHPVGERGGRSVCLRSGECVSLINIKLQIFPIFMYIDLILLAHLLVFFSGFVLPTTMPNMFLKTVPSNVLVSQMTPFFPPDQIYSDDVYKRGKKLYVALATTI